MPELSDVSLTGSVWKGSTIHLDDQLWRDKKKNKKSRDEIKITVKPSALIILQPSATIKT